MSDKPENSYAFPICKPNYDSCKGMTLRDYFAGQALIGMVANPAEWLMRNDYELLATHSYAVADVMMQERDNE